MTFGSGQTLTNETTQFKYLIACESYFEYKRMRVRYGVKTPAEYDME